MDRNEARNLESSPLTDVELDAVSGGRLTITFGSSYGRLGVAANAAQGGGAAEALYWLLFD
jgi:hypothetical protein